MNNSIYTVRNAKPEEFDEIGKLMVHVYSHLDGFPKPTEQPHYYQLLANIGELTHNPGTELFVAITENDKIAGGVVYFSDMKFYGSGGAATTEKNAAGFRLLAVSPSEQGKGVGKLLTHFCIAKAKQQNHSQLIIHTTKAMQTAWKMYEAIGFKRSEDLDFMQGELPVFGFRLIFEHIEPEIKNCSEKKLVGKHVTMAFSDDKTFELWRSFMPRRNEIANRMGPDLYGVQCYSPGFFSDFNPNVFFEKWAAIEVSNFDHIPDGMQSLIIREGLYAVFLYKGNPAEAAPMFRYIHTDWLPNSKYDLDNRPHFEILGAKYKNDDPDSEEEIWIPIKIKDNLK